MIGATAFAFFMFMVAYVAISLIPTLVARRRDHRQKTAIFVLGIVSICVGYFVPFAVYAVLFVVGLIWAYISPAPKIIVVEGLKGVEGEPGPVGPAGPQGPVGARGHDAIPLTDGRGFLKNQVAGE